MNSLLILPEEIATDGKATLVGPRALHAFETHGVRSGTETRCAVLGQRRGTASIISATRQSVVLRFKCTEDPPPRIDITLVAAITRPQTVKKVLQGAAMAGVAEVRFVRAERTEKSYLQSKSFSDEEVKRQIVLGLEQVWDSIPPQIFFHHSLQICLSELNSDESRAGATRLIGDVTGEALDLTSDPIAGKKAIVLIGPEAGWTKEEIEMAVAAHFRSVRIGTRAVRVEIAMNYFIGVLAYEFGRRDVSSLDCT